MKVEKLKKEFDLNLYALKLSVIDCDNFPFMSVKEKCEWVECQVNKKKEELMKIEKQKKEFEPVCITLETEEDMREMKIILKSAKSYWEVVEYKNMQFLNSLLQKLNN